MSVPLVESAGAVEGRQPQATTMTGGEPAPGDSWDFDAGGRESKPLIRVGSTRLGYEDVLLIIALVQVTASLARMWIEVRS